ncbi:MAG TPA: response regulator transcription factor [Chloroflexota bacterium]|jgi:DNA-binding NarL/FixJ family response regulator
MARETLRILIADDHPVFRYGMKALLQSVTGAEVVGEAATGEETIALAESLHPDVILMDIKMPGTNGIEATRRIVRAQPDIGIVVVTMLEEDDAVFAAMRAGARGYLVKGADQDEVLRAIHAVASGEAIFGQTIAERVMRFFAAPRDAAARTSFPDLTEREREILLLIAEGRGNPHIARRLLLSEKTVRNHISNIFGKLQVADRAEAIVRAREAGLGGEGYSA